MQEIILTFFHFAGIIIALGAVTVVDTLGFLSRKSKEWTQTTISAHHVTKPLIWLGTTLLALTWFFLYTPSSIATIKSILIIVLILNGCFLSFYVSPHLDKLKNKKKLFPRTLQYKVMLSAFISAASWWTLVFITILQLHNL